jgi:hypothetical protein
MNRVCTFVTLLVAACSDPAVKPDAAVGAMADASKIIDAPAIMDAPVDAPTTCPAGRACLRLAPVDGVTMLPAGRLGIVWVAEGKSPTLELAYDRPWTAAPITEIDLAQLALPTAAVQTSIPEVCNGEKFAPALVVLSTDPDSSGSLTTDEILNGENDGSMYGVHLEIIAWFDKTCPASLPDFPEGFTAGIHVYTEDTPVHHLDGKVTDLQTCQPGTTACQMLNGPL